MTELETLMETVKRDEVDEVREILDRRPELLRERTETGVSPVLMAAYAGADACLQEMLSRAPELDVWEAAALGDTPRVRERTRDRPDLVSATGADGWTPLHLAAFFGRTEAVEALLELGADLGAVSANATRNTPLHAALAGARDHGVVRALLEAGAPVGGTAAGGVTPLHLAASRGDLELIEELLARGAAAEGRTEDGKSAADLAEEYGQAEAAERLRRE